MTDLGSYAFKPGDQALIDELSQEHNVLHQVVVEGVGIQLKTDP